VAPNHDPFLDKLAVSAIHTNLCSNFPYAFGFKSQVLPLKQKNLEKMKISPHTKKIQRLCHIPPLHVLFITISAVGAVKYILLFPVYNVQPVRSHNIWDVLMQDTSSNCDAQRTHSK